MSKIILPTKYGGVPFLNDYLISKFSYGLLSFNFSEYLCNIDIFNKYHESKNSNNILKDFFNLEKVFISIYTEEDTKLELGSNDINSVTVISSNGKAKLEFLTYINNINILSPELAVVPYEHLTSSSGNKKVKRNNDKFKNFFQLLTNDSKTSFVLPAFFNNKFFSFDELSSIIELYSKINRFGGILYILPDFSELESIDDLLNLKEKIGESFKINNKSSLLFGSGHPRALCGISMIQASYAFTLSEKGLMIISESTFSCEENKESNNKFSLKGLDIKTIDITKSEFKDDISVLKPNCKCFACESKYTKAYLNHLFKCKELNGNILLVMHNLYFLETLLKNFSSIGKNDQLKAFKNYIKDECVIN